MRYWDFLFPPTLFYFVLVQLCGFTLPHVRQVTCCFWNLSGGTGSFKMHTICPIDFVQTPLNNRLLCFGSFIYAQVPKASSFLGHWKIGTLWENVVQYKAGLEVMKLQVTQIELVSFFVTCRICVMLQWYYKSVCLQSWLPFIKRQKLSHFCSVKVYEVKLPASHFCFAGMMLLPPLWV